MTDRTHLTTVEEVRESGSWLFTARDQYGEQEEIILVPCEDADDAEDSDSPGVEAWVNRCTHEAQKLDRGFGTAMRDGQIICPKHGSMFDSCSGYCDNGEAADTTLVSVDVGVEAGAVYLTDEGYEFDHEGSVEDGSDDADGDGESEDDDDDVPSSTSHIGF
ncbi:Rieske (2Fe-2S) protein [Halorussus lipolyticus]|uniref:Rieske (2Fe-2S) protein n=1 Tax=Halorussus lipolyticus TaxID=3034024 RepID=UPI0023E8DF99|nr:Rieske 2Fe-2S domain-containing protein [Halorussus sp. DT80]